MHEVYTPFFNPALEGSFSVPWNPILWAPLLGKASANYHCSLIPFCSTELQNRRPEQFYALSYKYNIKMTYIKLGSKKSIKCLSVTTKNSKVLCNSSSYPYTSLGFISQPPDTEMCQSEYALCVLLMPSCLEWSSRAAVIPAPFQFTPLCFLDYHLYVWSISLKVWGSIANFPLPLRRCRLGEFSGLLCCHALAPLVLWDIQVFVFELQASEWSLSSFMESFLFNVGE